MQTELGCHCVFVNGNHRCTTTFSQYHVVCANNTNISNVEINRVRVPNVARINQKFLRNTLAQVVTESLIFYVAFCVSHLGCY